MAKCEGSKGESTPEYEGSDIGDNLDIGDKDGLIGNEMGLSTTEWAYRRRNGLIGDRMGISATEWAYRQRFLFWFGFGTVANCYQRRLPEPSRMVQRLGLGLGLDRREWLSVMVWVLIGDGVGSYRQRFGSYRRRLTATYWDLSTTAE